MDTLDALLQGIHSEGALFKRCAERSPFALRFIDRNPLTLCTVLAGMGYIAADCGAVEVVRPGDAVIVCGSQGFTFLDRLGSRAEPVDCGSRDAMAKSVGIRSVSPEFGVADDDADTTVLVCGGYSMRGLLSRQLLDELPAVLRVPQGCEGDAVVEQIALEIINAAPGQQVALDRLLDWMLVRTIRAWFDRPDGRPPTWWSAQRDPVLAAVLHLLHTEPSVPWTVAKLGDEVGVARSTLAKRFTEGLGEPPLAYLTRWRMTLAADLLGDPQLSIARVARAVGYSNAFGFSAAFKRIRGVNPSTFRQHTNVADGADSRPESGRC